MTSYEKQLQAGQYLVKYLNHILHTKQAYK